MEINTNISSVFAANSLQSANNNISDSVKRISSGLRLSTDDPSSIGKANRLKAQIVSLAKANDSVNNGIGALQMMDSSLTEISNILLSMKELAVSSSNATSASADRTANDSAYQALLTALDSASKLPTLNGTSLLNSSGSLVYRIGAATTDTFSVSTYNTGFSALGLTTTTVDTTASAATAEGLVDTAINTVAAYQAKVGGQMKVLQSVGNVIDSVSAGATSAYSGITSTDLAKETASLAASQIRQNAAAAMFAQSNTMSREVVSYLLKGV